MNQDRTRIIWRRCAIALSLLAMFGFGCSPSTLFFLMRGDDKREPVIPLPAKEGKDHVMVAIFTSSSPTVGLDFAGSERELGQLIGQTMTRETAGEKRPIRIVEQSKVDRARNTPGRDWRTANLASLGKELEADYVLDITVNSMSMNQPEFGGEFYQGRANLQVVVYDSDRPEAPISDYPHTVTGQNKGVIHGSSSQYRKNFLQQVATEIAHQHISHIAVQAFPNK
jgi:hypothetical protein